jgi:hypothetical protein
MEPGGPVSLADRLRRAALAAGDALGVRRRPGVELVRVDPTLAPPSAPPWSLRALPAPEHPLCPRCRIRHEPRPHPADSGGFAAYGRTVLPEPARPEPLGRGPAHDKALYRDQVNPWRDGIPDLPPASLDLDQVRGELYAPRTDWPYWREGP